ncbi:MAG: 2-amino-4-hydroxy-6-hydroxymethyldihydropteridine diphosphokinase [Paracoccaceae bacterium]
MGDLALVALGGNMPSEAGKPAKTIACAAQRFRDFGLRLKALSAFYATPCFPSGAGPDYVNAAAVLTTDLDAGGILQALHQLEEEFGRARKQRWGQRTLDLDLIALGDNILPDRATQDRWRALSPDEQIQAIPDQLILPHPRLQDRSFVLVPLADVAPAWIHPLLNRSIRQLMDDLPGDAKTEIKRL